MLQQLCYSIVLQVQNVKLKALARRLAGGDRDVCARRQQRVSETRENCRTILRKVSVLNFN